MAFNDSGTLLLRPSTGGASFTHKRHDCGHRRRRPTAYPIKFSQTDRIIDAFITGLVIWGVRPRPII